MILRKFLPLLFVISLPLAGWAQGIIQVGIPHTKSSQATAPAIKKGYDRSNARVTTPTITLPFWEDFSTTKTTYADTNVWYYGNSIRISDGMAVDPPSLRVATFDGIDSVGSPYNVTDILAKGYADKLVSGNLDLSLVDPADRNTVWLSYMYEMKGNGELPDAGDRLLVTFLDNEKNWIPVDTIENDGSIEPDVFYTSFIQINEDKYFHPEFKFSIQNFARLSGPYDTWHVDYIYINKGRVQGSSTFNLVPDRTISEPPGSIFGLYRSIPVEHFLLKEGAITTPTSVVITNRNTGQPRTTTPNFPGQPMQIFTTTKIGYRIGDDNTDYSSSGPIGDGGGAVPYDEFIPFDVNEVPDLTTLAQDLIAADKVPDSVGIYLELGLNTDDNHSIFDLPPGDFDPDVFHDIDFRSNDTTRTLYTLQNKYAYDDGSAEYGAGLNQPGAQVAYKYELIGAQEEDITFLELYFPRFGDESSQVIELRIWDDLAHDPIYREVTTLQRSSDNKMWLKQLTKSVHVDTAFYIGWKQSAAAVIAVGLDKNTDTGDRMWSNTSGSWEQNTFIHGSLMMRPIFGEGSGEISGLEDETELAVYPNPSSGTFYFSGVAETISVYDMTGRSIPAVTETTSNETKLTLNASQGIYIIKAHVDGRVKTTKVMIH